MDKLLNKHFGHNKNLYKTVNQLKTKSFKNKETIII